MSYRETPLEIRVSSVGEECDLRIASVLKAGVVQCGVLKPV